MLQSKNESFFESEQDLLSLKRKKKGLLGSHNKLKFKKKKLMKIKISNLSFKQSAENILNIRILLVRTYWIAHGTAFSTM